jgi:hypothetical protein
MRKPAGGTSAGSRAGSAGATARRWGGSQPRPSGWGAYGRGTAARPGCPAPAGRRSPPLRISDDRAARTPGRAVLHAPGILSPRKITVKGAPDGASLAAQGQTLDCDLPRQDLGTYQQDGEGVCMRPLPVERINRIGSHCRLMQIRADRRPSPSRKVGRTLLRAGKRLMVDPPWTRREDKSTKGGDR